MPIAFVKQTVRNKVRPIFLTGGDLRMRSAYKKKTNKISVLGLRSLRSFCTDFVVFFCVGLFKVSDLGPLEILPSPVPYFSWCPLVQVTLVRLFPHFSKVQFLCRLFGASAWPLHGHCSPLKPVRIYSVPSSHSLFILNNSCTCFHLKPPKESCLHLSVSAAEIYQCSLLYQCS